ncbi:MAG: PAS domain S-box protein [Proteobacteria bacterium]|nr:PAS domain S-box protein [Pseudomonadota bacterium]
MTSKIIPTNREVFFEENEIIVSKTDTRGRMTYVNDVFLRIAGYSEDECLGKPHSMIRHPDMPRAVFKLLWETIASGSEIFAYVKNMTKNGDHYWVIAHVTPTRGADGSIMGYHSNRRVPERTAIERIQGIYRLLNEEESRHSDPRKGVLASSELMLDMLEKQGTTYEEFMFSNA